MPMLSRVIPRTEYLTNLIELFIFLQNWQGKGNSLKGWETFVVGLSSDYIFTYVLIIHRDLK